MYQKHKVIQLLDPIVSCLGTHAKKNNSKMKKKVYIKQIITAWLRDNLTESWINKFGLII